jgi:hypothetical protein
MVQTAMDYTIRVGDLVDRNMVIGAGWTSINDGDHAMSNNG